MVLPAIAVARSAAKAKHMAATRKVSRLKAKGVELAGTEFDPRKPWKTVSKYNAKQLAAYTERVSDFLKPTKQFVSIGNGVPVPKGLWEKYKRVEREYNATAKAFKAVFSDAVAPGERETIGELTKHDRRKPTRAVNDLYAERDLSPEQMADADALKVMTEHLNSKLKVGYESEKNSQARSQCYELIAAIGNPSVILDPVMLLDDKQFSLLWNHTKFAEHLKNKYLEYMAAKGGAEFSDLDNFDELLRCIRFVQSFNFSEVTDGESKAG